MWIRSCNERNAFMKVVSLGGSTKGYVPLRRRVLAATNSSICSIRFQIPRRPHLRRRLWALTRVHCIKCIQFIHIVFSAGHALAFFFDSSGPGHQSSAASALTCESRKCQFQRQICTDWQVLCKNGYKRSFQTSDEPFHCPIHFLKAADPIAEPGQAKRCKANVSQSKHEKNENIQSCENKESTSERNLTKPMRIWLAPKGLPASEWHSKRKAKMDDRLGGTNKLHPKLRQFHVQLACTGNEYRKAIRASAMKRESRAKYVEEMLDWQPKRHPPTQKVLPAWYRWHRREHQVMTSSDLAQDLFHQLSFLEDLVGEGLLLSCGGPHREVIWNYYSQEVRVL